MSVTVADFAFSTQRLRARPLHADDHGLFCDLYCDPLSMRLIGPPLSPASAMRALAHVLAKQESAPMRWLTMVIEDKQSNTRIGLIGCPDFDPTATRLEIGLMLCRFAHGQGYPREVLHGFVAKLFDSLPVNEIWAQYPLENKAADRAIRSIGFLEDTRAAADGGICRVRIRTIDRSTWAHSHSSGSRRPDIQNEQANHPQEHSQ